MVTPRFFPFMGGVENHVYQVARRLAARGQAITVLTTDPSCELPPRDRVEGVEIVRVRAWPRGRDYYLAPALVGEIARRQCDVVHVQSYHTLVAPLAMWAAWRANLPYVVTFHGGGHSSTLRHQLRGVQQYGLRPLLARAARLVAVARFEIGQYSRRLGLSPDRFALIPNGCDITPLAAPPARDPGLIVSIGRLERYKGHQRVIAALPYLLQRLPEAHLWVAGSGPYEPELRRLAQQLGVANRVEIRAIPASNRKEMAARLAQAALTVLLSEYETQPIAILEALALGSRALVADTSGLHELAEQGLARAIPLTCTPREVAAALLQELRAPAAPAPVKLPTWDDCADSLAALYTEVRRSQPCVS